MFRTKSTLAALTLALIASTPASADPPPPPPPGAVPPPPAYANPTEQVASGRITQLLINPNGDVDGLLLDDGTQVNFPPHLSSALTRIAHNGDAVSVQGIHGYGVAVVRASVITNRSTGQSMIDQPPAPGTAPPPPLALTVQSASGHVAHLLYTERGELNGAILDQGMIVRFPPHIGAQLQTTLGPGAQLVASGYGTQNAFGQALEATSLSIDGQTPIALFAPAPR